MQVARRQGYRANRYRPYGMFGILKTAAKIIRNKYNQQQPQNAQPAGNEETAKMISDAFPLVSMYRYKRKRKGYRFRKRRRAYRRFARKVKKVMNRKKVMNIYNENHDNATLLGNTTTYPDKYYQNINTSDEARYSLAYGTLRSGTQDINQIFARGKETGWISNGAIIDIDLNNMTYYFKAHFNATIQNPNDSSQEYDLYECVAAQDIGNVAYGTPGDAWENCLAQTAQYGGLAPVYSIIKGATPFTCPRFGKWWKVLRRTRVRIPSNGFVNFDMSTKGTWTYEKFSNKYAIKGITKSLLIVSRPMYGAKAGVDPYTECIVNVNKWFKYYLPGGGSFDPSGAPMSHANIITP